MFASVATVELFPTHVWIHQLPPAEHKALNAALLAAIDELVGPRPPKQGFRTYQTDQVLHRYKAFAPLVAVIGQAVEGVLEALAVKERSFEITGCWANFGEPGSAHMPHHHANNYLSGVYYLAVPEGGDRITFHDPRPQREIIEPAYEAVNPFNQMVQDVKVAEGALILFPGWITHSVKPNKSQGLRISVAFNVMFADYAKTVSPPRWPGSALKRPPDL
jgi:uncharacterized protein (TIGR02466 family)